jgi:hypothetical protein
MVKTFIFQVPITRERLPPGELDKVRRVGNVLQLSICAL